MEVKVKIEPKALSINRSIWFSCSTLRGCFRSNISYNYYKIVRSSNKVQKKKCLSGLFVFLFFVALTLAARSLIPPFLADFLPFRRRKRQRILLLIWRWTRWWKCFAALPSLTFCNLGKKISRDKVLALVTDRQAYVTYLSSCGVFLFIFLTIFVTWRLDIDVCGIRIIIQNICIVIIIIFWYYGKKLIIHVLVVFGIFAKINIRETLNFGLLMCMLFVYLIRVLRTLACLFFFFAWF